MNDKGKAIAGLAVFLVLATFPIWHTLGAGGDASPPDLELPEGSCIEPNMVARHMDLLDNWRNKVVRGVARKGESYYTSSSGVQYEMSLTKTCMGCHTNRETFCYRCHEYANVPLHPLQRSGTSQRLQRGIRCWDCHVESKGS